MTDHTKLQLQYLHEVIDRMEDRGWAEDAHITIHCTDGPVLPIKLCGQFVQFVGGIDKSISGVILNRTPNVSGYYEAQQS